MRETTRDLIKDIAVSSSAAIVSILIFEVLLGLDGSKNDSKPGTIGETKETKDNIGGANNGSSC